MNYAGILKDDVANGRGIGVCLFVSGCRNNCEGCFNKEQQDFNYGKEFTPEVEDCILELLDREYIKRFSILGGEPLEGENVKSVYEFAKKVKEKYPNKIIWLYTGFIYEDLLKAEDDSYRKKILDVVDVIVDGPFIISKKDISLKFRGSSNQRVIDVKASKETVQLYNLED